MAEITYVKISELTAAGDAEVTDAGLLEMAVVDQNSSTGYTSKKVTRSQLTASLKDDIATSASISSGGLITFKNDDNTAVFTLQLPLYNGGVS